MSNPEEVQPLITEPVTEPLIEPTTQPVVDTSVPIPEGYVDDEKGKMNTIEVVISLLGLFLVLCKSYERYCWYWFIGSSYCFFTSTNQNILINSRWVLFLVLAYLLWFVV